jgi:endoglucanase
MRPLLFLGVLTGTLALAPGRRPDETGPSKPADAHTANRKLGRGINLGNALEAPREGQWGVTLRAEYFRAIKAAGFDSVRLPVKWSAHAATDAPYTIDAKFARRVDWAIDQAVASKLNIIVNVHHYSEMDVDPARHLPRLVALWEQLAARYRGRPVSVYFELLNEPHDKLGPDRWNAVIPKLLAAVRKTNPNRPVIVGAAPWNSIGALEKLSLPRGDQNLIATIHYYDPFEFTHQGAPWAKGSVRWKGRKWTGTKQEQESVRQALGRAAAWGKKHGRPIFLGEFGAYQEADLKSRAHWTGFVKEEAQRLGFSWAYWEFCAGFGAYDPTAGSWRKPLRDALLK